jgi:serine/threonine protein kinase
VPEKLGKRFDATFPRLLCGLIGLNMNKASLLPGSSDPTEVERRRLDKWLDQSRDEHDLHPADQIDFERSLELIQKLNDSKRKSFDPTRSSTPRFTNPKLIGIGAFGLVFSVDGRDSYDSEVSHPSVPDDSESGPSRTQSQYAIKLLRPSKSDVVIAKKRFLAESQTTATLHHPNIVSVYEQGAIDSVPYLVTELADEGTLASYFDTAASPIPPRHAAWLMRKIAEAVHCSHSYLFIHRDIKPGNILLRRARTEESFEGIEVWPLLTDFGLSKNLTPIENRTNLTVAGEVLGTLRYMSPEQVLGEPLQTQSDIFSLGVVFHEMVYGTNPFLARNDFSTRENIVKHPPKLPMNKVDVPREIRAILAKCLQKSPQYRYQAASSLATDLENYLEGKPLSISTPSYWEQLAKLIQAAPIASSVLGTIFACSLILAGLLSREWNAQRKLANERQEIGQLFLQSIQVANGSINDTILAGARVSPKELLDHLNGQIELLEKALSMNPEDALLMNNLQILRHYASICYYTLSLVPNPKDASELQQSAITQRKKSLELIERLLVLEPGKTSRLKDRIVGEHWMSVFLYEDSQRQEKARWIEKTLEHSKQYLTDFPEDIDIAFLAITEQIEQSLVFTRSDPKYATAILEETIRDLDALRFDNSRKYEFDSNHLRALSKLSNIAIALDDIDTTRRSIERCFSFAEEKLLPNIEEDWRYREYWTTFLDNLCLELEFHQRDELAVEYSRRWQSYVSTLSEWVGANRNSGIQQTRSANLIAAKFYELEALRRLNRDDEYRSSLAELTRFWRASIEDQDLDQQALIAAMRTRLRGGQTSVDRILVEIGAIQNPVSNE